MKIEIDLQVHGCTEVTAQPEVELGAIALDAAGKVRTGDDLCIDRSGRRTRLNGALAHNGERQAITLNLPCLPDDVFRVAFFASIYDGELRGQSFGQFDAAHIVVRDFHERTVLARVDLKDARNPCANILAVRLTQTEDGWALTMPRKGIRGGPEQLMKKFGVTA